MGIFSGAGAYGSACILLDKVEYVAGDVVSGRVRLSVATRIDRAEPIRMTIEGCETLAYDEEETRRVVVQPREGDENHHSHEHQVKHVNHEKLKYTMLSDAIILDVPARSYEPGMYEFPFEYQLPVGGLVPTFAFKSSYFSSHLSNVRACAEYELKVRVPLVGMFKVDIRCSCTFVIRDEPSLQAPCRVTESKTLPGYYLVFWQKGTCSLTATLEQNVVPVGGAARVEVLVNNDSTRCVDSVTTALSQIVKLNHTKSSRDWSGAPSVTRKIASNSSSGIEPGENMNAVLTQAIEYDKKGSAPLMPTMRSHFLSFQYELNVKCRQAWCWEDPSVTFPIVLTTKSV